MHRNHILILSFLLVVPPTVYARQQSVSRILNINGQMVGTVETPMTLRYPGPVLLKSQTVRTPAGREGEIATGIYFLIPQSPIESGTRGNDPGFADVTSTVFPQQQWDAGAIRTGDLNGDSREDVVFSRYTVLCDSIGAEDRPRVWIQTPAGTFVDETEARVPPIIAPADDMILFDADGDGDKDIFLRGYQCGTLSLLAAILINDGTGHFTDQTATRLPSSPGGARASFVMRAAAGSLDNNASMDLVLTVMGGDTTGSILSHPEIWLNDGSGYFTRDTLHRINGLKKYGYFMPYILQVNPDTLPDILYANVGMVRINPDSGTSDTISGQTACFRNIGNAFFHDETTSRIPDATDLSARLLAPIDVNADGVQDFLEVHFPSPGDPHQISLFQNSGSGIFSETPGAISDTITGWFNAAAVAPFDGDDYPDVFLGRVAPGADGTDIFLSNNNDGTLKDASALLPPNIDFTVSCDTIDVGHKGAPDIVVGNFSFTLTGKGQNRFYFNLLRGSPWVPKESGLSVRLNDVLMLDSISAIVVGDSGTIAMTRDAGKSWELKPVSVSAMLNVVRSSNPSTLFVAGDSVLLSSTDAGATWAAEYIQCEVTAMGIAMGWVGYDLYLGRRDGVVMKGAARHPASWTEFHSGGGRISAFGFGPGLPNSYSVRCASQTAVYSSMNEGITWDTSSINGLTFWDEIRSGDLSRVPMYLTGGGGDFAVFPLVLRSDDTNWTRLDLGSTPPGVFNCVRSFASSADVYVCGWNGMIYKSIDAGSTWTRQLSGTTSGLWGVSFVDQEHGVAVGDNGTVLWLSGKTATGADNDDPGSVPDRFILEKNYPNPFNPSTTISLVIREMSRVTLKIYDLLGREVAVLIDEMLLPGRYERTWNAVGQASGVYYYRLSSGSTSATMKLVLVR